MPEAVENVRAARDAGAPVVISFTVETDGVETDGRVPTGDPLDHAIAALDSATEGGVAIS